MDPQDPKGVAREAARDLTDIVRKLAALKADASQWLAGGVRCPEAAPLENAHAAAEAAVVGACRRVRFNEEC